jgi:hypothetical protein
MQHNKEFLDPSLQPSLIFFVYPDPMGSEEPSPDLSGRARRSQNQFTPLGAGVNKLIFKRFWI